MKYLKLRLHFEPKIIGVNNGVAQTFIDKNGFNDINYYTAVHEFLFSKDLNKQPNFEIVIECVRPIKGMKVTDAISFKPWYMSAPFIISQKVVDVFEKFNLINHYYFPVKFSSEIKVTEKYYMFYHQTFDNDILDINNCLFFKGSEILGKEFISYNELTNENIHDFDGVEYLAFSEKLPTGLDLFKQRLTSGIIISERLWKAMEDIGITGFLFTAAKDPILKFPFSKIDNVSLQ